MNSLAEDNSGRDATIIYGVKGDQGEKGEKGDQGDPVTVNGKSGPHILLTCGDLSAGRGLCAYKPCGKSTESAQGDGSSGWRIKSFCHADGTVYGNGGTSGYDVRRCGIPVECDRANQGRSDQIRSFFHLGRYHHRKHSGRCCADHTAFIRLYRRMRQTARLQTRYLRSTRWES